MFLMVAEVLDLQRVASQLQGNVFWEFLAYHQSHVPWVGLSLHDMIQPSFSFMVGVSLPFSLASRQSRGDSVLGMIAHACRRALILIFLGIFLRSLGHPQTRFTFDDTLTQIGLGYVFLFLLAMASPRAQIGWLVAILLGYWAAFALYPAAAADFDYASVGVPPDWPHLLDGFTAHWNKNTNLAAAFEVWFLNLFPRPQPFLYHSGGYLTLNFVPTLGTMIMGLLAGNVLRGEPSDRVARLIGCGALFCILGLLCHFVGIVPIVKRIWTPSFALVSGGLCMFTMAALYQLIDVWGYRQIFFPLRVIGMNSIAIYCMSWMMEKPVEAALHRHLGDPFFLALGEPYESLIMGALIILVFWLILYWMFRRELFLRI